MSFIEDIKSKLNKFKFEHNVILKFSKNKYRKLIHSEEIQNMIQNMPPDLDKIEKAYYVYLELGKIVNENPKFVYGNMLQQLWHYHDKMNSNYNGICRTISELYANILSDKRIGIEVDLVKSDPKEFISHIDTILKIDGKNYIVNLISDLSRIKTGRRTNSFCFHKILHIPHKERLEKYYGELDYLTREEREKLDKKLGYSYFFPQESNSEDKGFYTEDAIELLKEDLWNPERFQEYVLKGKNKKDCSEDEIFKSKIDYIFDNINKITQFKNETNYLEQIRYYLYLSRKLLDGYEESRIKSYAISAKNNPSNITSILKIMTSEKENGRRINWYYVYSKEKNKFVGKSYEEMYELLEQFDKNNMIIIGNADYYRPQSLEELEL